MGAGHRVRQLAPEAEVDDVAWRRAEQRGDLPGCQEVLVAFALRHSHLTVKL